MQCIREMIEAEEKEILCPYAAHSYKSRGREKKEEEDSLRTCYMRDRDRILHSHAFRREKGKTQVFIAPKDDHIMNRLTHSLEVSQIATTIARCMSLNTFLTEAIALGHDTAHTCFGHAGESALNKLSIEHGKGPYLHAEQAYRRLNKLSGLNLTYEVLDGIRQHSGLSANSSSFSTIEGRIVQFADKIAYLTSDFENAISMGIVKGFDSLPKEVTNVLGSSKRSMINKLIHSIVDNSIGTPELSMETEAFGAFVEFREFNFREIYYHEKLQESNKRGKMVVRCLFEYYMQHPEDMTTITEPDDLIQSVIDHIAGMTDSFALDTFRQYL